MPSNCPECGSDVVSLDNLPRELLKESKGYASMVRAIEQFLPGTDPHKAPITVSLCSSCETVVYEGPEVIVEGEVSSVDDRNDYGDN